MQIGSKTRGGKSKLAEALSRSERSLGPDIASVDISTLEAYQESDLIKCNKHANLPLLIWNYTDICQWKDAWDEVTNICRGLITNRQGLIVGRSFDKFHNLDVNKHTPDDNFVLYEKLDGSLIILFYYENEWIVASRGSFIGPQVTRAQKFLIQKYDISKLEKDKSHVFELLYPENKIVVDYGDREEMVYLASFRKDGAESFDTEIMEKAGFAVVRTIKDIHGYDGHYDAFKALNLLNSEGAVVRFGNGSRAKIKFENYVQSHHKRADLNVFGVWKAFKEEKLVEDLAKEIPDESYDWLNRTWTNFENRVAEMRMKVQEKLDGLGDVKHSRALFARTIKDDPDKALLFALYYDKPTAFHKAACDKCKPEA